MRPRIFAVAVAMVAFAALPSSASAATCSDYDTQAEAQRAADTRDADGDGIYCESLPCPCLKPGSGGGGGGSGGSSGGSTKPKTTKGKKAQKISARITSVVDGDTVKVRAFGAKRDFYTVRLIGIDTPETKRPGVGVECGGKRATARMLSLAFTKPGDTDDDDLVDEEGGDGRRVTLRTDPTQDTFDRYGRLLAYVTTRGGTYLQSRMLADGWAKTYVYRGKRFQRYDRHRTAERRAKKRKRGVWRICGGNFHKDG